MPELEPDYIHRFSAFRSLLMQVPHTIAATGLFREACRRQDEPLMHGVLHALSHDLGTHYVVRTWLYGEVVQTLTEAEREFFDRCIEAHHQSTEGKET